MKKIALFLTFCVLMSSCATIFTGTKTNIMFNSEPSGATVEMDGLEIGTTPLTYPVKKSFDGIISFEKDGYERKTIGLQKSFNAVSIINLGSILGWIIDVATGSIKKFDQKGVKVELREE